MARAIIRYSIDHEGSNVTGNAVRGALQDARFEHAGTATFDARERSPADLISALRRTLEILDERPGGGEVDHLWIYMDRRG